MTTFYKLFSAAVACLLVIGIAADDARSQQTPFEKQIVGNWKYGPATQKDKPAVETAKGYVTITDMKRWIYLGNDEGDVPGVGAWTSYSGPFVLDRNKVTITVDVATNPAMVGKTITRYINVQGKELQISTSPPLQGLNFAPAEVKAARPC